MISNTKESVISEICDKYHIKNYTIQPDGTVDVKGDVDLRDCGLVNIPLHFGTVTGMFMCSDNRLIGLKGFPINHSHFSIHNNPVDEILDLININDFMKITEVELNGGGEIYRLLNRLITKFIKYLNEFDVIDGNMVFEDRLKLSYYMSTEKDLIIDGIKFNHYTLI